MSNIDLIKELRGLTNLPFDDIKKALDAAGGDKDGAINILREKGAKVAKKKSERGTKEGLIETYVHGNGKIGVMLELFCETDFVARNPLFKELAHDLAMHIAATDPDDVEELLKEEYIKNPKITVQELLTQYIAQIGENIQMGEFVRFAI